jgi:signal transduction histidine kinase
MTERLKKFFVHGFNFVRNNPQIIYTFFLVIVIPLAFVVTSEQFLKITRENQNKLERNRISILEETFALFAGEHMRDPAYLSERITALGKNNETMRNFQVLGPRLGETYPVIASLNSDDLDTGSEVDNLSTFLLGSASGNPRETYATSYFVEGERYWRGVRAITATSSSETIGYIVVDLSMSQSDAVMRKKMRNAYGLLGIIILLIIIMLARQARIIDYATLYQRLKEVDQMKDDFVSMAAHELRTPLTVIRGYANLLKGMKDIPEAHQRDIEMIDASARDLAFLVDDILDVARIQEGRMSFTKASVDLKFLLSSVVSTLQNVAQGKGLVLRIEFPDTVPVLSTDEKRIKQVFTNIIGNALKYTFAGEVVVRADVKQNHVVVRVSDTGIGISADDQKNLFQKFYRVKSKETEDVRGTGLGLWITHQIVKEMGGTISIESIKGKGTDFIITLPVV